MKSSNGILLGFSELLRKFYAVEVYSEAAKMFRRVYINTYGGQMIPWKFVSLFSKESLMIV